MSACDTLKTGLVAQATYTSVNDGNLDALTRDTSVVEFVDLGHQVGRECIGAIVALLERLGNVRDGAAHGMDSVAGQWVTAHGENVLDLGQVGQLGSQLLSILGVLELNGSALEQLEAQILAQGSLAAELFDEGIGVLDAVSLCFMPTELLVAH